MTRTERRKRLERRRRQIARRVFAGACALAFLMVCVLLLTGGGEAEETATEPLETAEAVVEITQEPESIDPLDPDILALVQDVMIRWMAEKVCVGDVGRVLPAEYLYFTGDWRVNTFRDQYQGRNTWDWSLDSPYEE